MSVNMTEFGTGEHALMIPGPRGVLEAQLLIPAQAQFHLLGIVCHPHSLQGGTMGNKVVHTVGRAWRNLGIPSIRFNFRGVGQSDGEYDAGMGETDDLLAVYDWLKQQWPKAEITLAGFSFGSFVAYRAASLRPVHSLLTIAPPVHHYPYNESPEPTCPWFVIQGDADEVVPPEEVYQWLETLHVQPKVERFAAVGHFFHGKLVELREVIEREFRAFL